MWLTKEDLNAIGILIDEKLESTLAPIKNDIKALKQGQKTVRAFQLRVETEYYSLIRATYEGLSR